MEVGCGTVILQKSPYHCAPIKKKGGKNRLIVNEIVRLGSPFTFEKIP